MHSDVFLLHRHAEFSSASRVELAQTMCHYYDESPRIMPRVTKSLKLQHIYTCRHAEFSSASRVELVQTMCHYYDETLKQVQGNGRGKVTTRLRIKSGVTEGVKKDST